MQDLLSLKAHLPDYLQSIGVDVAKASRNNTACPVCRKGMKTGCFHYYPDSYKVNCYSCGFNGDLFDLIAQAKGMTNKEAIAEARKMYNVGVTQPRSVTSQHGKAQAAVPSMKKQPLTDYTKFLLQAEKENDYEYLQSRGISADIQRRFHVGFVPNWRSPKAVTTIKANGGNPDNLPTSPRCIIPRNKYNYLARDTRSLADIPDNPKAKSTFVKYEKQNTGETSLFNFAALEENPVIVVEGEIDAMSICEVGGNAVALCGISNRQIFFKALKEKKNGDKAIILMLDDDEPGRRGKVKLEKGLDALGIVHIAAEYPAGVKDPNEWLMTNKEELQAIIPYFKALAEEAAAKKKGNEYNAADLLDYFRTIERQPRGFEAKTGFDELDKHLCGGLHEGLYIIGAISSLGKTTFTLQLADQIAARGQDVIFFSLEMSKYELMGKSLSRLTYQLAGDETTGDGEEKKPVARDTQQIINNRRYGAYNDREKAIIAAAIEEYGKAAPHIYIYEGRYQGERLKVSHIRAIVEQHIQKTKQKPVVFVDYLQIIAPADPHATDKQNTDANTFELKEISRDFQIPVFAVSSFNRDNYQEPVSMQSFKESGAIEYSSDVLFGLQYEGMDYQNGEGSDSRKKRLQTLKDEIYRCKREREPIVVELKCLKQRTGYQFTLAYAMLPAYNYFAPIAGLDTFTQATSIKDEDVPLL